MNEFSAEGPQRASRLSAKALINSGLRFVVWLVLVGGFLMLMPEFKNMSEEFGIGLPVLSQVAISLSDKAIKFSIVIVPLVILALVVVELGLLSIPRGKIRGNFNKLAWLVLLIAIILIAVAVGLPLNSMLESRAG